MSGSTRQVPDTTGEDLYLRRCARPIVTLPGPVILDIHLGRKREAVTFPGMIGPEPGHTGEGYWTKECMPGHTSSKPDMTGCTQTAEKNVFWRFVYQIKI